MTKVLLSFVGNRDPWADDTKEPGAALTLSEYLRPEFIYLLPSAKDFSTSHTEDRAKETQEYILEIFSPESQCYIRPLTVRDPTEYSELLPKVRAIVSDIVRRHNSEEEQVEFHLNVSSGTPQMNTCFYVLANSGFIPKAKLWQVLNPEKAIGERVRPVTLAFLEEENILHRLRRYMASLNFRVMSDESENMTQSSVYLERRNRARFTHRIFKAYELWDHLQYQRAYDKLLSVKNELDGTIEGQAILNILSEQVKCLRKLKESKDKETPTNLLDIYYNAKRCYERGNFVDTLARFWRFFEGTVYYFLRERYGYNPREQYGEKTSLFTALEELKRKDGNFKNFLQQIVKAKRSGSEQPLPLEELLNELRERRNKSVAAHGMDPVEELDAKNSLMAGRILMEYLLASSDEAEFDLESYPLKKEHVEAIVNFVSEV